MSKQTRERLIELMEADKVRMSIDFDSLSEEDQSTLSEMLLKYYDEKVCKRSVES